MESWRDVPNFPGYEVSDLGRVRSSRRNYPGGPRVLRPTIGRPGGPKAGSTYSWLQLNLRRAGYTYTRKLHKLVMEAFVGPPPDGLEVRHLNGDSHDNRLVNLAYGTKSENANDTVRHGNHNQQRGRLANA